MSVQAMAWVIEKSRQRGSKFVVLLMIANHSHSDGTHSFCGYERLGKESRISARRVMSIVEELTRSGELAVEKGAGPHGTNLYSLPLMSATPNSVGVKKPSHEVSEPNLIPDLIPGLHPNHNKPSLTEEKMPPSGPQAASKKELPLHRLLSDKAVEMFVRKFRQKPTWNGRHFVQLATLEKVRPGIAVPEFAERYANFLNSPVPFHRQQGGSLAYFCSQYDAFIEAYPGDDREAKRSEPKQRNGEMSPGERALYERYQHKKAEAQHGPQPAEH
jgi:hypothetical protein